MLSTWDTLGSFYEHWGTFGDSQKFNSSDSTEVHQSFVVEMGRGPSPPVNASPSLLFPVPGILCLLHDYWLKALHWEVFRDRKSPWRKIKYCLVCRKSTEASSPCSRAHPKPDNFPPYLPAPPPPPTPFWKGGRLHSPLPNGTRAETALSSSVCTCRKPQDYAQAPRKIE